MYLEVPFTDIKLFTEHIATTLPKTKMVYISMKPSLARWHLWEKYQDGDRLIKEYTESDDQLIFMDSSLSMLDKDGQPRKEIFIEDDLHMNAIGYARWTEQLRPILKGMYTASR